MSIPIFFVPPQIEGRRVYDGGLRNNFPVTRFLKDHAGAPFIALYLSAPRKTEKLSIGSDLLDIWIDGEDREVVDANTASVVIIDTSPIGTVDFNLSQLEKDFLLKVGRASALRFLKSRNLDNGPADTVVQTAIEEAEKCREHVRRRRKQKSRRKLMIAAALLVFFVIVALVAHHGQWLLPISFNHQKADIDTVADDLTEYRRLIVGDAGTASNNDVHSRPEVIGFRWKRPLLFGTEQFELCLESRAYLLNGYAVEGSTGGGWARRPVSRRSRKAIAIVLDTSSKTAYVFYRRDIPATDHYDSEHGDPDLLWSIGRVRDSSCPAGERSRRQLRSWFRLP